MTAPEPPEPTEPAIPPTRVMSAMPRDQRAYVIVTCAIIGAAFAYAACEWGGWPKLRYLPLRGELTFDTPPTITMIYAGLVLWGIGGLVTGAVTGALLCRLVPRPWPERALHLFGAWAITAVLLSGGYFTWGLWPW
jgi:hypothetical protein